MLLLAAFLDELSSGIAPLAAPEIEAHFRLTHGMSAGWPIAAQYLLGLLIEPPIYALADRHPKRRLVLLGLVCAAAACIVAGLASSYAVLLCALLFYGPANGVGIGLAQAALVDANPHARERVLMRWTLWSSLGDLAAPLLMLLLASRAGWRAAFWVCGLLLGAYAAAVFSFVPDSPPANAGAREDPSAAPPLEILRATRAHRRLLWWALALALCGLLDETFVAFGALYLRDHLHATVRARSLIFELWMFGSIAGLVVLERMLSRFRPLVLLAATSGAALLALALLLWAPSWQLVAVCATALGAFVAPQYPLAKAQAYHARPGESGVVNAFASIFMPLEIALPLLIGLFADRISIAAALAVLALQPLVLLALAVAMSKAPTTPC